MSRNLYIKITVVILILLFAYTASSKTTDHIVFKNALYMSIPGHRKGASIIAWLIPIAEYIVAVLLSFQQTRVSGLSTSLLLLLIFTCYPGFYGLIEKQTALPWRCDQCDGPATACIIQPVFYCNKHCGHHLL